MTLDELKLALENWGHYHRQRWLPDGVRISSIYDFASDLEEWWRADGLAEPPTEWDCEFPVEEAEAYDLDLTIRQMQRRHRRWLWDGYVLEQWVAGDMIVPARTALMTRIGG